MSLLLSVSVPFTPLSPSPASFLQSSDSQLVVLTRTELNIFTPATGIQVDVKSRVPPSKKGKERVRSDLKLFRTSFIVERKDLIEWGGWSNDDRTTGSGSGLSESHWKAAAWSPSGLNQLGGCVLATLTSNHEVLLFEPVKNAHKGEWVQTFDITAHIVRLVLPQDEPLPVPLALLKAHRASLAIKVLQAQATTIAWSTSPDFLLGDNSLFIVGHKSGHLSLWSRKEDGGMVLEWRGRIGEEARVVKKNGKEVEKAETSGWISGLCFSSWFERGVWSPLKRRRRQDWDEKSPIKSDNRADRSVTEVESKTSTEGASCLIAISDTVGSIWILEVEKSRGPSGVKIGPAVKVESGDGRAVSAFCWVWDAEGLSLAFDQPKLVYTKLRVVCLVNLSRVSKPEADAPSFELKGTVEVFELPSSRGTEWEGTTVYSTCCGIIYSPLTETLLLTLSCSSFYNLTLSPLALTNPSSTDSSTLTSTARDVWIARTKAGKGESEGKRETSSRFGERIGGVLVLDGPEGELGWITEQDDPNHISYTNNSLVKTTLVIYAPEEVTPEQQLAHLSSIFTSPPNSRTKAPLLILRSSLHFISDFIQKEGFVGSLLELLPLIERSDVEMVLEGEAEQNVTRDALVDKFVAKLFGDIFLEGLRMRENVARFVQATLSRQLAEELTSQLGSLLDLAKPLLNGKNPLSPSPVSELTASSIY
ncbi:hypothetical protein P7C70_g4357, partial [Phenoliferia sp. Uapishka_3]